MAPPEESGQYFRESTRAPLRAQVVLQVDAFKDREPAHTGNLSLGGMFVELEKPVPVGTIVKFELELESSPTTVRGTAEVVWIRTDRVSEEKPAGVGLQFRHLEGEGNALVRGAIEEVLQAQGLSVEPAAVLQPEPRPRARPRRTRPRSAPSRSTIPPPKTIQSAKKRRKKQAPEGSKKEESPGEDRKKLIMAIILILILMYVLSRALG